MKHIVSWILALALLLTSLPAAAETLTLPQLLTDIAEQLLTSPHAHLTMEDAAGQPLGTLELIRDEQGLSPDQSALYLWGEDGVTGVQLAELLSHLPEELTSLKEIPLPQAEDGALLASLAQEIWAGTTASGFSWQETASESHRTIVLSIQAETLRQNLIQTVNRVLTERESDIDHLLTTYGETLRLLFPHAPTTCAEYRALWNMVSALLPATDLEAELHLQITPNNALLTGTLAGWQVSVSASANFFRFVLKPGNTLPPGTPTYELDSRDMVQLARYFAQAFQHIDDHALRFEQRYGATRSTHFFLDSAELSRQLTLALQHHGLTHETELNQLITKYQSWIDLLDLPYELNARTFTTMMVSLAQRMLPRDLCFSCDFYWMGTLTRPWHLSANLNGVQLDLQGDAASFTARMTSHTILSRPKEWQLNATWSDSALMVRFSQYMRGELQKQLSLRAQWDQQWLFATANLTQQHSQYGLTLEGRITADGLKAELYSHDRSTALSLTETAGRLDLSGLLDGDPISGSLLLTDDSASFNLIYDGQALAEGMFNLTRRQLSLQMTLDRQPFNLSLVQNGNGFYSAQVTAGNWGLTGVINPGPGGYTLQLTLPTYSLELTRARDMQRLSVTCTHLNYIRWSALAEYLPREQALTLSYRQRYNQGYALQLQPNRLKLESSGTTLGLDDVSVLHPEGINATAFSVYRASILPFSSGMQGNARPLGHWTVVTSREPGPGTWTLELWNTLAQPAKLLYRVRIDAAPEAHEPLAADRWENAQWLLDQFNPSTITNDSSDLHGSAYGKQSAVSAYVTLDDANQIASLRLNTAGESLGFGMRCGEDEAFVSQFIGQSAPFVLGQNIDALAGATITSRAAVKAVNDAWPRTTVTGEAPGIRSMVKATVTVKVDSTIETLTLDTSGEGEKAGAKVGEDTRFINQFKNKTGPFTLGEDGIDYVSNSAVTAAAAVEAINRALFPELFAAVEEAVSMPDEVATVQRAGVRLLSQPGAGKVLAVLGVHDAVSVLSFTQVDDALWYQVQFNQQTGYVHSDYLKLTGQMEIALDTFGRISGKRATVYAQADTSSQRLGILASGREVRIHGLVVVDGETWYRVSGEYTGYMKASAVMLPE